MDDYIPASYNHDDDYVSDSDDEMVYAEIVARAVKRAKIDDDAIITRADENGAVMMVLNVAEMLCLILTYLDFRTLVRFGATCRVVRAQVRVITTPYFVDAIRQAYNMMVILEPMKLLYGGNTSVGNYDRIRAMPAFCVIHGWTVTIAAAIAMRIFSDDVRRVRLPVAVLHIGYIDAGGNDTAKYTRSIGESEVAFAMQRFPPRVDTDNNAALLTLVRNITPYI